MSTKMKKLVGCVSLFMSLALASQAGQYWWSGNGTTLGGNGTWNETSATNWGTSVAGPFNIAWPNVVGDEAVFTNVSGTVTLGATPIKVNAMTFLGNAQTWNFNSGTLDFGSGGSVGITNNDIVNINSSIAGSGTLTFTSRLGGWGRGIALNANNSNFTGKMSFVKTSGNYYWVWATSDLSFGAVPGVFTADALTFNGVNIQSSVTIAANRGITLGGTLGGMGGNQTYNSVISGSGGLYIEGSTVTLNAVNTYAGNTSGRNGSYIIGIDNALPHGAGKGVVNLDGRNVATLDLKGHELTVNALDFNNFNVYASTVDNTAAGTASLILGDGNGSGTMRAGTIIKNTGGALSLTKIGTGTQTLIGPSTYTGATTVNAGTLTISGTNSASSGMVVNGGTLLISGFLSNAVPLTVNAGGTLQADLSVNTNGVFNSASTVTIAGGTLNIKGKNSGTSATALGDLAVNPSGSTISITPNGGSGTTLTLSNTWTRQVGGTLLVDVSVAGSTVVSSPTLQNGILGYAFVKDNTGLDFATVTDGNIVRYTAATLLDATVAASNMISTANYYMDTSRTLKWAGTTQTVNSIRLNQASLTIESGKVLVVGSGGIISSNSSVQNITGGTLTVGGSDLVIYVTSAGNLRLYSPIADNGVNQVGVTIAGGTVRMEASPVNTYTGDTVVNQGGSILSRSLPYGNGKGKVLINSGAYWELAGASSQINGLSQSTNNAGGTVQNTYNGPTTLTLGNGDATASFSGVIIGSGANALTLNKVGAGTQTLSGVNTYSGGTILSNGVLSVSSLNNIGGASAKVTFAGGTLRVTGTTFTGFGATPVTVTGNVGLDIVESTNAFTFTNDVPGTLTKTGSGSLSVSGAIASLVTDNRTLVSGSGSVADWTLKSLTNGSYTPAGPGENVTGNLKLEGSYTFRLNSDGTGDRLTATGAVTMNSIVITIPVPANLTDKSKVYTLVQGSSLSGDFSLASILPQYWKLKKEGNVLVVRYVSPGTMVTFF